MVEEAERNARIAEQRRLRRDAAHASRVASLVAAEAAAGVMRAAAGLEAHIAELERREWMRGVGQKLLTWGGYGDSCGTLRHLFGSILPPTWDEVRHKLPKSAEFGRLSPKPRRGPESANIFPGIKLAAMTPLGDNLR
jgi:hypothetical protein